MGEIPLMTTHRLVRHQRHRARHRLAAAPLAGRVLRARPRQDALLGQAAVLGAHHSVPRLVARFRVRPEGLPVLPRRPPPQDAGDDPAEGARLHARADPRASSSRSTPSTSTKNGIEFELVPERLRGEIARFDIIDQGRQDSSSPKDKRITVKHVRDMEAAGMKKHHRARRLPARPRAGARTSSTRTPAKSSPTPTTRSPKTLLKKLREAGVDEDPDASTPTTSTRARTSRRPCASTRPPTSWRRRSRSTA